MDFKVYLSTQTHKNKWSLLSSSGQPSVNVEVAGQVDGLVRSLKEAFGLTGKAPGCVGVVEGGGLLRHLSCHQEEVAKVEVVMSDKKHNSFSKFLQHSCETWKDEQGQVEKRLLQLLQKTSVSTLHSSSLVLQDRLDFSEYLVKHKDSEALKILCEGGLDPNIERFIKRADAQSIEFIVQHTKLPSSLLQRKGYFHLATFCYRCLPEAFPKLKLVVLTLSRLYPGEELKTALKARHADFEHKNAVEHACGMQAEQMLELFWSLEGAFKTSLNEDACEFDVSNLIPDTIVVEDAAAEECLAGRDERVSCLERIIASSVDGDRRAARMLSLEPLKHLLQDYVVWSKCSRALLFCGQVLFMAIFSWRALGHTNLLVAALQTCYDSSSRFNSSLECVHKKAQLPSVLAGILFSLWPLLTFIFSFLQMTGFIKLIRNTGMPAGVRVILTSFPYYDLTLLVCFILRIFYISNDGLRRNYFELVSSILILGWIRPTFYLFYTSYLSAFAVALRSSMLKYIVCFIFLFTFVYVGFSLAFKTLFSKHSHVHLDKPIDMIAYVSFVTLFGMGELDQMPEDMEEKVHAVLFLKLLICMYCACTAVLILAMIRQPDEELVARVGSELKSTINLRLLKDVAWLLVARKKFKCKSLQADEYGSVMYELKTLLGLEPRSYRLKTDHYKLVLTKDELGDDDDRVSEQMSDNIDNLQVQLASVHKLLLEVKGRLDHCS